MRVSVIVAMPARETLRALSAAAFAAEAVPISMEPPTTKGDLLLDPSFPPLP